MEEILQKPNFYTKGKIYSIRNFIDDDVYIGSTTQELSKRLSEHKKNCSSKKCKNYKINMKMNELGMDNFYIELELEYPCENKEQLRKKEGEIIRSIGTLNKQIAGRTNKEYYDENRDLLLEKNREYHKNNKDKIKAYQEANSEHIKERALNYYLQNKEHIDETSRQYRKNNPEYFRQKKKEYREKHKDAISERAKTKHKCSKCGSLVRKGGMNRHQQTSKCQSSCINNNS